MRKTLIRYVLRFENWFKSDKFPEELEMADVEDCVLAWADAEEVDLGDKFEGICETIVELGIC